MNRPNGPGSHCELLRRCTCGRRRLGESWDEHIRREAFDLGITVPVQAHEGIIDVIPTAGDMVWCPCRSALITFHQYELLTGHAPVLTRRLLSWVRAS